MPAETPAFFVWARAMPRSVRDGSGINATNCLPPGTRFTLFL
jgi:hypothetical protein